MSKKRKQEPVDPSAYPAPYARKLALDRMNEKLAGRVVCARCGATEMSEAMQGCKAEITEVCDGFVAIELSFYPDGRTVLQLASERQIARVRSIIEGTAQ